MNLVNMGRNGGKNTRNSLLAQRACSLVFSKLLTLLKKKKREREKKERKNKIVYLMNMYNLTLGG